MTKDNHEPVLLQESIEFLKIKPKSWYLDATFGRGGHTKEILKQGGKVIALDWDHEAIEFGKTNFANELKKGNLILLRESFINLSSIVSQLREENSIDLISGVLFDFGTSSNQLKSSERGFSFEGQGQLDMRMDQRLGVQAKDLLALIPENQLADLFRDFGGETDAKKISKAIKQSPIPITTVQQLSSLILEVKKNISRERRSGIHPATKVFQALRIAVNTELDNITESLPQALNIIEKNGRIVTIAFHDGEDRIVKKTFKEWESRKMGASITGKPIAPSNEEINNNPRSRSAKLRVFEKK
jgi:16S rRNA (cytosine1402-N4)-methyltransferase